DLRHAGRERDPERTEDGDRQREDESPFHRHLPRGMEDSPPRRGGPGSVPQPRPKISAPAKKPDPFTPPATRTRPSSRRVAVWNSRASAMLPVYVPSDP